MPQPLKKLYESPERSTGQVHRWPGFRIPAVQAGSLQALHLLDWLRCRSMTVVAMKKPCNAREVLQGLVFLAGCSGLG